MSNKELSAILKALEPMLNSRLDNYIIPGLASELVGGGAFGKVRLFSTDREARDFITPHSHRFDFTCLVLAGTVYNTIYTEDQMRTGDEWLGSTIDQVCGQNGLLEYKHVRDGTPNNWDQQTSTYVASDTYSMKHHEVHSIRFERGSRVLFFEGPQVTTTSRMIEPWVNGRVVPTFKTEAWMFQRQTTGTDERKP